MKQPDLLITGAGPTGLTLACEARRHGLSVRIIDLREAASIYSKAQIVHARTLEMLDDMGIAERFQEQGIPLHSFNVFDSGAHKRLVHLVIAGLDSKFDGILSISQHHTEVLLAERLTELGVEVERRVRLTGFTQGAEGVTATLVHEGDGDREETVTVPWLAGCDGAHSTVRHTLDLPFEGERYPMHIIQADARVDLPFPTHDDEVLAFVGAGRVIGLFPLPGGEHRYRFLIPRKHEEDIEPTLEHFQAALDEVGPEGARVSDPKWMVGFRIHCRMVRRFREGRVFIAGDAGHVHSPAGGQGMNMGMQDAYNLAWKLALLHQGHGTEALLESYSAERQKVVAETLDWTGRATKGALLNLGLENKLMTEARDHLAGFVGNLGLVQQRVARAFSMLDVAYEESPVCEQWRASLLGANVTLDASSEAPSVRAWYAFGGGPAPGHRAPDVVIDPADGSRLHGLLQGTTHTLLLFDGAAATLAGYENLSAIAHTVQGRLGDHVRTYIVVPGAERPEALDFDGSVVLDPASNLHSTYGATTECLYLIRPDGYIGFRSQPAELEPLMEHLGRILVAAGRA